MTNEELHDFRKQIDHCIVEAEAALTVEVKPTYIREMSIVRTKLQEAKMWVGKCLEVNGSVLPAEYQDKANQ